ncbi:hypothetical protein BH23ACT8_BH23ACT8_14770 [soil metagenome]|jgi:hypothetical protein
MVPLDEDTLAIVDRIARTRSPGRPLPHPRTGKPVEFLLTHHGKRVSTAALRDELGRRRRRRPGPRHPSISSGTPMRPPSINAGVSLQARITRISNTPAPR